MTDGRQGDRRHEVLIREKEEHDSGDDRGAAHAIKDVRGGRFIFGT
jgi:hypothetical protein